MITPQKAAKCPQMASQALRLWDFLPSIAPAFRRVLAALRAKLDYRGNGPRHHKDRLGLNKTMGGQPCDHPGPKGQGKDRLKSRRAPLAQGIAQNTRQEG